MSAKREYPAWVGRTNIDTLTRARLDEMRAEAVVADEKNAAAFAELSAAYASFSRLAREFGQGETIRRNGRAYIMVPIAPGSTIIRYVEECERNFAARAEKREQDKRDRERRSEVERQQRKANLDLARMILRYGAPDDSDWCSMLDLLRGRNKYLDLALACEATRGDWSEGFYRVSDALRSFTVEDERDKDIVADLYDCMDSDDGRIFRDTRWNYSELYKLVGDDQLVADAQMCLFEASR